MNKTVITNVLDQYQRTGAESALIMLIQSIKNYYENAHVTILLPAKTISTIKNQDDVDELVENYWKYKRGELGRVYNRIKGNNTLYYILDDNILHGGRVITAVMIAEVPASEIPREVVTLCSMLTALVVSAMPEDAVDPIAQIPCVESLLDIVKTQETNLCIVMFQLVELSDISSVKGWSAGDMAIKGLIEELRDYSLYAVSRGIYAFSVQGDITRAYDSASELYQKCSKKLNMLIAEVENADWDMIEVMQKEIQYVSGINILYAGHTAEAKQMNLFDLMDTDEKRLNYQVKNVKPGWEVEE